MSPSLDQRDRAADRRLRPDMADAEAARGAGETSVGDQRDLLALALAVERRGGGEHLAHAGTAARAFPADDENVAFLVFLVLDRVEAGFLAVEATRRAGEFQLLHAGDFDDGAFGREIALEADHAAGREQRLIGRTHDVLVRIPFHVLHVLGDRAAGDGQAIAVHEAVVEQCLHQQRHAACFEHILGDITAARFQICDIRCLFEDFRDIEQIEFDAAFVRDRRQMQRGIGGTAGGGDNGRGIFQRLAGDDVARADVLDDQVHDHLARQHAELVAHFVRRRRAGRIRQRQADGFRYRRHGVGGELRAAGAGRGTGVLFERLEIGVRHLADRMPADRFVDVLHGDRLALEGAGQDRAAVDVDRRAR